MSQGRRVWVTALVAVALALLAGCSGGDGEPVEAETEVTAEVVEVIDEQAFIVADGVEPLLVLTFAPVDVDAGDRVVVVGELRDFDPELPQQLRPLPVAPELFATYEGERVLVADDVSRG